MFMCCNSVVSLMESIEYIYSVLVYFYLSHVMVVKCLVALIHNSIISNKPWKATYKLIILIGLY